MERKLATVLFVDLVDSTSLVTSADPEVVRAILSKDLDLTLKRHRDGQAIFKAIGDAAPAMGMIGTLIGLVQMLGSMNDPKQIAPAMAIALLTTLFRSPRRSS